MPDLNSLGGIKNWLIGGLLTLVGFLLVGYASDNRRRIDLGEEGHRNHSSAIEQLASRTSRLEERQSSAQQEVYRRLDRIESKVDRLIP